MKNVFRKIMAAQILCISLLFFFHQKVHAQVSGSVSFQVFYDDLSPYGEWVDDPRYGNVWVPDAEPGFRPYYSQGHWVMTDYGNTWVSDYPWGWAPYHYGRWTYDPYYGWVWVPGYEWAPAWVSWRNGSENYGWAPLAPGISISVSSYNCPVDWWVFVGPQYLYDPGFHRYWRGPQYNTTIINRTTFITNTYVDNRTRVRYNYGPRPTEVERFTHRPVPTYKLAASGRPGERGMHGNSVALYRPAVSPGGRPPENRAMKAPQAIGGPHAVGGNANKQPAFRQVVQERRGNPSQGQAQQGNRPENARPGQAPAGNRPQPQKEMPRQTEQRPQQPNRPAPQREQPRQPEQRPQQQPNRPAPQREQPRQPEQRPQQQPQREIPKQQPQREQPRQPEQRPQPTPQREMPRQQPQREQPRQPEQHPQPQPQREMPRQEPPHGEPHGGKR